MAPVYCPQPAGVRAVSVGVERATDPAYLQYQYGTTERLHIRMEAHQRYSERQDDFVDWVLDHLNPSVGDLVLDVGCGVGSYHAPLCKRGVRAILGIDASKAMIKASQRHANANHLPVVTVLGDAQSLPVAEAGYDCAMANHVLFLVPDQRAALRELRRALRPGGRMVATTTGLREQSRLALTHARAAVALGYAPAQQVVARFSLDHLDLVREVFPNAQRFVREDAFVFPTTEAALRYYASGAIDALQDMPADGSHRPKLLEAVAEQVESVVRAEGVFRDPKDAGCYVATV